MNDTSAKTKLAVSLITDRVMDMYTARQTHHTLLDSLGITGAETDDFWVYHSQMEDELMRLLFANTSKRYGEEATTEAVKTLEVSGFLPFHYGSVKAHTEGQMQA